MKSCIKYLKANLFLKQLSLKLFLTGFFVAIFSSISLITLNIIAFTPLIATLTNISLIILLIGIFILVVSILIRPLKNAKKGWIEKGILLFVVISIISSFSLHTMILEVIGDTKASLSNELYVVEGIVSEAEIIRKTWSGSFSATYMEYFKLDNNDEFAVAVKNENNYLFQIGIRYKITALPYSRVILKSEIVD